MPLRGVFVEFQSLSKSRRVQTSVLPKKAYFLRTILPIFFPGMEIGKKRHVKA